MSLSKYKDIIPLTSLVEIENEIFILQKDLFNLRIKRSTSQTVKPHSFLHTKRRIAQLKFRRSSLLKSQN